MIRRRDFLKRTTAAAAGAVVAGRVVPGAGTGAQGTLLTLSESGPNNLDIMGVGTNRPGYEASWNTYDRLLTYGVKKDENGNDHYDYTKFEPELAELWDLRDMSVTFKLRKDATFHDGTPITANDVKWSFDRAVTVGGVPTFQFKAGSLEKPEQFVVVDDHTFRIDFLRKDKLTFPDLAVPTPIVINSGLAKKHATDKDPWAMEWLKNDEAGGGAFQLEKWTPGQEMIFRRFDELEIRTIAKDRAGDLANRAVGRQPPGIDGARRRRHLGRSAAQGRLRDGERKEAAQSSARRSRTRSIIST